jgi:hypothetical protein
MSQHGSGPVMMTVDGRIAVITVTKTGPSE